MGYILDLEDRKYDIITGFDIDSIDIWIESPTSASL